MSKKIFFFTETILILVLLIARVFPMSGKAQKIPVRTYTDTEVSDGEFLHYAQFTGGEKYSDYYYVTVRITNENSGFYFQTFFNIITVSSGKKPASDFRKWPAYFIIDPKIATEVESEGHLTEEDTENWPKSNGLIYWHYLLNKSKGCVEYSHKMVNNHITNENKYIMKYNTSFPCLDIWSGMMVLRFLDFRSPGILYSINPVMKDPVPLTFKPEKNESITVKAGTFQTGKFNIVAGDPFLGRLMEPMLKSSGYWQENTIRRLIIKDEMTGVSMVLEEISNINVR